MTKREICKRLIDLRDNMIHGQDSANSMGELSCVLSATGKLIRDLLLDLAAPEEEEEEWLQHLDDEPNLTYAVKDFLRRYFKEHGDMNTVCDQCKMAHCCDSSVHEVCQTLQKENREGK